MTTTKGGDIESPTVREHSYGVSFEQLCEANTDKSEEFLVKLGGLPGLAKALKVDPSQGIDTNLTSGPGSLEERTSVFGANRYRDIPPKNFFALVWEVLQDPIVILLCFAAGISTVIGAAIPEERAENHWIEGVAIWIAVCIVTLVGAGNDYSKDRQFRKLNAKKDAIQVKVVRNGQHVLIANTDIVVGEVMLLDTGDKACADGVVIEYHGLMLDEASLTGESDPMKKTLEGDPWIRSGTQVTEGSGSMLVVAVGENSEWGKTLALVNDAGDSDTPLQEKLEVLAGLIGKVGTLVAVVCFIAQLIKWCVDNKGFPIKRINDNGPVQFLLYSITIIVVAVPEGLPLAVTISLAYSMKKMMKDNNFVRVLAACETMGGATAICSDKTGTLTENRMTVVEGWFGGKVFSRVAPSEELAASLVERISLNCAMNAKAFLVEGADGRIEFVGNRTECALLLMLDRDWRNLGGYNKIRKEQQLNVVQLYGFSSTKKMASVLLKDPRNPSTLTLYNKGAAEWVLKRCVSYLDTSNNLVPMSEAKREELLQTVTVMAKKGLRCICLSYKELPAQEAGRPDDFFDNCDNLDNDLTAMAIVGIKDPVRPEVPEAVRLCQHAGIVVRMVTGDNIFTAQHIARECGILNDADGHFAMEGPTFRNLSEEEMLPKLPKLRVLARSSPEDKLKLVRLLKQQGEVVAVTGDGTNDAPALKESDVGLAMGIAGTEVAKEAADIVIMDDNFSSIVKSVLWGRSVFANIRKFLMFQLTVNFVALVTAFVGAVVGGHEPLNVLQLLWVNLIMDTMGALALATEDPTPELLDQKPNGRTERLINRIMIKHVLVQGFYQLIFMFFCLYALPNGVIAPSRYEVHDKAWYYGNKCEEDAHHALHWFKTDGGIHVTQSSPAFFPTPVLDGLAAVGDLTATQVACNAIGHCGFPYGSADSPLCQLDLFRSDPSLVASYNANAPIAENTLTWSLMSIFCNMVPTTVAGLQGSGGANPPMCEQFVGSVQALGKRLGEKAFQDYEEDAYKRPLSMLFNIFIFCQVANEVNARRINDELTFFSGLFTNHVFLLVIAITIGLQAIIINFLGMFFKVERLDWDEWLICLAIGMGAWPLSFVTRLLSRRFCPSTGAVDDAPEKGAEGKESSQRNGTASSPPELQVVTIDRKQ